MKKIQLGFPSLLPKKRLTDLETISFPTFNQANILLNSLDGFTKMHHDYVLQIAKYKDGTFGVVVTLADKVGDKPVPLPFFILGLIAYVFGNSTDTENYCNAYCSMQDEGEQYFLEMEGVIIEGKYKNAFVVALMGFVDDFEVDQAAEYLNKQLSGKWFQNQKIEHFIVDGDLLHVELLTDDEQPDDGIFDLILSTLKEA